MQDRFTLSTTAAPRTNRRPIASPTLTVERNPLVPRRANVTLESTSVADDDIDCSDFIVERRAEFIARQDAALTERIGDMTRQQNGYLARVDQCARFKPKATRESYRASERERWRRLFDEAMHEVENRHAAAISPSTALTSEQPETRTPGVYSCATASLGLSVMLVEASGVTMRVEVCGDTALQARLLTFLSSTSATRSMAQYPNLSDRRDGSVTKRRPKLGVVQGGLGS